MVAERLEKRGLRDGVNRCGGGAGFGTEAVGRCRIFHTERVLFFGGGVLGTAFVGDTRGWGGDERPIAL